MPDAKKTQVDAKARSLFTSLNYEQLFFFGGGGPKTQAKG
jgi:hypothetical protein